MIAQLNTIQELLVKADIALDDIDNSVVEAQHVEIQRELVKLSNAVQSGLDITSTFLDEHRDARIEQFKRAALDIYSSRIVYSFIECCDGCAHTYWDNNICLLLDHLHEYVTGVK